jgi:hypothetical protein
MSLMSYPQLEYQALEALRRFFYLASVFISHPPSSQRHSPEHQSSSPTNPFCLPPVPRSTFVNKHPQRLHCFYTKNSTFIHGVEGEDGLPCTGQAVRPLLRAPPQCRSER